MTPRTMATTRDEFTKYDEVASRVDGFDQATGITYLEQDGKWLLSREDPKTLSYFRLKLDQRYGYSIDMFQGDFEYVYRQGEQRRRLVGLSGPGVHQAAVVCF